MARLDDVVRRRPLLRVGHLPREDGGELLLRHPRPREDALALDIGGSRDDDDRIQELGARGGVHGLEEERYVEAYEPLTIRGGALNEGVAISGDKRVHQGLQPFQGVFSSGSQDCSRKFRPIDTAVVRAHARECIADRLNCSSTGSIQRMHAGIRIVDGKARTSEELRSGRLAHADRACQADDNGSRGRRYCRHQRRGGPAAHPRSETDKDLARQTRTVKSVCLRNYATVCVCDVCGERTDAMGRAGKTFRNVK